MSSSTGAPPLPNLLIAGVAKAATTSLFRYLAQHPDVCASDVKELRYFTALRYGEPLPAVESYSRHFAHWHDQRYRMEATPGYYAGGRPVAEAVNSLLPGARVIVSFRDPVTRCWSWYQFVRSTARIPKDMPFADYLDRCERLHAEGVDGQRVNQPYWGLGGGCYDSWLEPWLEIFGERFRIEFFEHVVQEPRSVMEGLHDWLGISTAVDAGVNYEVENKTVQYKYKRFQQAALTINRRHERFFSRHPDLKRGLRSMYYRVNGELSEDRMDADVRARLTEFYAPHNKRLAARLAAAGAVKVPDWLALECPA